MFQKNHQHPALLCEQDLKQDCVGAKRPPRNFKHPDLSPISAFWKDCSSAFHRCEEAVRVFWSNPSAPDCWTAAAPRTPKEFLGVHGVQTCNRCGRGCWPWRGLVFQLEAMEILGAILLFRTSPIERLCAMPMCHWRGALKWNEMKWNWSCMPSGGTFRAHEVICKTLHAQAITENVTAKVKPARQWRVRFGAQGQMWEETAISIPTANCINSSIDCSHKARLRTATFCQLSHRFHLANSSIFVTHVFGLLPHFSHAVAILMLVSPNDWVEGCGR